MLLEFNFLSKVCGMFFFSKEHPTTHTFKKQKKKFKNTHTQKHTFVLEIVPRLYFDIFSNLTNHSVCFLLPIQIKPRRNFFTYFSQCQKTTLCQGKGHSSIMHPYCYSWNKMFVWAMFQRLAHWNLFNKTYKTRRMWEDQEL